MEFTRGRSTSSNRGGLTATAGRGLRPCFVILFLVCLAVGQVAHAINVVNISPNDNCEQGDVGISGSADLTVSINACTVTFNGEVCAHKGSPACCANAPPDCTTTIDRVTLYSQAPTLGSPCTGNGYSLVLCEGAGCDNPVMPLATLRGPLMIALYSTASIKVDWTDSGTGVSWGSMQVLGEDKEPPDCKLQPSPTLSEWGLILMAGLLALGGVRLLRRRMLGSE